MMDFAAKKNSGAPRSTRNPQEVQSLCLDFLNTELLHVRLPDLSAEPGRCAAWGLDLLTPALEDMDAVGSALTEADVGVSTGSSLEGGAAGLTGSENGAGVVTGVLQNEVLLVGHSFLQNVIGKEREELRKLGIEVRSRILGNRLLQSDNREK